MTSELQRDRAELAQIPAIKFIIDDSSFRLSRYHYPMLLLTSVHLLDLPRLNAICSNVLDGIMASLTEIPHGIRWLCRQLVLLAIFLHTHPYCRV